MTVKRGRRSKIDIRLLKKEIVDMARAMRAKGWVANHTGNITARIGDGKYLATPTAMSKGDLEESDLIVVNDERRVEGKRKVFSEIGMHLCAYRARSDVMAVVHAHPPYATAFAVCRIPISKPATPEFAVSIGPEVPLVEFALHNSAELERGVAKLLPDFDVLLLANHGVLGVGSTLKDAYLRLEHVEHQAGVQWLAKSIGRVSRIDEASLIRLAKMREAAGLGRKGREKSGKNVSSKTSETGKDEKSESSDVNEMIREMVREELKKYSKY